MSEEALPAANAVAALLADLPADFDADPAPLLRAIRATATLPSRSELPTPVAAYVEQVSALRDLLSTRQNGALTREGWTPAQVVAHLYAVDSLAAEALGLRPGPGTGDAADLAARTAQAQQVTRPLTELVEDWTRQAAAIARHVAAGGPGRLDALVPYLGTIASVRNLALDRAAETWFHTEELRATGGLPLVAPPAEDLSLLCEMALQSLPSLPGSVRVELTGPGGGVWTLGDAPETTLVAAALDFCRVAVGFAPAASLSFRHTGDAALAGAVAAAAGSLARL